MDLPRALVTTAKRLAVVVPMAVCVGSVSAFFLWSLDGVTRVRFGSPWLLYLLPLGGLGIGWLYWAFGRPVAGGQVLLLEEIRRPGAGVPRRMAPLILLGTLSTHLFGGSAGREGTALQIGGGIAAAFSRALRGDAESVRIWLVAGVAAGFGSVFGTPFAGAIFAVEVLRLGRVWPAAVLPAVVASWAGHVTCHAWGGRHAVYEVAAAAAGMAVPDPVLLAKMVPAAAAFGLTAALFIAACHRLTAVVERWIRPMPLRPMVGGLAIIALVYLAGTRDYLGLGILAENEGSLTLQTFFASTDVPANAWLWKLLFTVVTVASGFKGGEVTPLFFIGAALGNALAWVLGAPLDLFAAAGFIAVFAAATKTPLASTAMGIELFGGGNLVYFAAACIIACRLSGSAGLYRFQSPGPLHGKV
jgi:H+/Cl- antiporter ClcA